MADTGLQRSVTSFRRQGSSGLVWDDRFIQSLNQIQNQQQQQEQEEENQRVEREEKSDGTSATLEQNITVEAIAIPCKTVNVVAPSIDPPSPKVPTCGFCVFFGQKSVLDTTTHKSKPKSRKRRFVPSVLTKEQVEFVGGVTLLCWGALNGMSEAMTFTIE
ncbi:unnamed protein product [Lupinus luteus]|uniref:MAPK kinase substrate protein n=1 Tax=Lupinus luteus TaxID=3873 RepID=A0AAV1XVL9_LUPLU